MTVGVAFDRRKYLLASGRGLLKAAWQGIMELYLHSEFFCEGLSFFGWSPDCYCVSAGRLVLEKHSQC